ncbi:KpsF/GutQ family sugar-phosphate isomerase [Novosphingobium huizhouense]|uniref:KpsF/GutQ family sugar-phosphate isomerase n=1 Tax=Novosphingobium huizhouense TaxID=2866625 RepID=UPI001CD881B6|nr:KpsF/GutQ family sugar-phosphate isomerase [Novosphingobium huizhouense]
MLSKADTPGNAARKAAATRAADASPAVSTVELLSHGRTVIQTEAKALGDLSAMLDERFAEAVRTILATPMRVVVTGMGKSGHIGRKIAATFAATGTPAIFVHPAEAAHGDLGMLVAGDTLLVVSNSGNTAELRPILAHAAALGCAVIGMASRAESLVIRRADVALMLPQAREACPANIAPTTSTTLMLALGDALAVAAMRARGVTRERLQALHPGGAIGARLMPIADFMRGAEHLPLVAPDRPMREVLVTMTEKSLGIAGVVDDEGMLIGVITDGDLRRHVDRLLTSTAREVMTRRPKTIEVGARAGDALAVLAESRITALFVVDAPAGARREGQAGRPVGIVHIHDFAAPGPV